MSNKIKEDIIVSEETITDIISVLHKFPYSKDELETISLPLAQWLCETGFTLEDTCYIISSIINITNVEKEIDDIYNPNYPPIHTKTEITNIITEKEYKNLEKAINKNTKQNNFTITIDSNTKIKVDFKQQKIFQVKEIHKTNKDPEHKIIPVIEAVPKQLIVYDSEFVEGTRSFKITWSSQHSRRNFITAGDGVGATIKEIERALVAAGYSHNQKLIGDALSATINGMIDEGYATVKDTIDNKGVYYHDDKVVAVKLDVREPTTEEMISALEVLTELHKWYRKEEIIFATVLKWSLVSVFSHAMKQAGKMLPWLYLVGAGQAGKTTLGKIGTYFYGKPVDDDPTQSNNIGGTSFNSEYRIGNVVSKDCTLKIVNEPASTFKYPETIEAVKNCIELKIARKVQGKIYFAFSPIIFTANNFVPDADSLYRRLYFIDFNYNQRKIGDTKDDFEAKFNIDSPSISIVNQLSVLGRFAVREIIANPSLLHDDWKELADNLFKSIYESVDMECPKWLLKWSEDKDLNDLDDTIIENIQSILVNELYNAQKRITIQTEHGFMEDTYMDLSETSSNSSDFEPVFWELLNKRAFSWALPHQPSGKPKSIFLNQGFKRLLNKHFDEIGTLKSIGQLLGWEYRQVRFKNSRKKGLIVPFDEFMEFVYPSVE